MNNKRYVLASLMVFVFIFVFEWFFHGVLLHDLYTQTQNLWRAKEDVIMPAMFLGQLTFPFIFTFIFIKGYENKGIGEGIRYGILIGLLFIPSNLIYYAVMPLPFVLVGLWILGGLIEMILAGAIVSIIYRKA